MGTQKETALVEHPEVSLDSFRTNFPDTLDDNHAMGPRIANKLKLSPASMPSSESANGSPAERAADDFWASLHGVKLDQHRARQGRIVAFARSEPAYASFGVLRTKMLRSLRLNNWTTVAITSPEPGCGKSAVAMNLAFSLTNLQNCRVVLLDLDFRRPRVSSVLGADMARPTAKFLEGKISIEGAFVRYGDKLAVSADGYGTNDPAELLQSQSARLAMVELRERLRPDVVLVDLPPVLGSDDVLAFLPNVDCTLLVVGAGLTTIAQVRRCEQELVSETNILGMVLNKCQYEENSGYY